MALWKSSGGIGGATKSSGTSKGRWNFSKSVKAGNCLRTGVGVMTASALVRSTGLGRTPTSGGLLTPGRFTSRAIVGNLYASEGVFAMVVYCVLICENTPDDENELKEAACARSRKTHCLSGICGPKKRSQSSGSAVVLTVALYVTRAGVLLSERVSTLKLMEFTVAAQFSPSTPVSKSGKSLSTPNGVVVSSRGDTKIDSFRFWPRLDAFVTP